MALLHKVIFLSSSSQARRSLVTSFVRLLKHQDSSSSSSDSDLSSDDELKPKKTSPSKQEKKRNSAAAEKLNSLLKSMLKEKQNNSIENVKLNLAKPRENQRRKDLDERSKYDDKKFEEKLVTAVKEVAGELGGDPKKTEAELLFKLLYKDKSLDDKVKNSDKMQDNKKELGTLSLNDILTGMKIDRSQPNEGIPVFDSKASQIRNIMGKAREKGIDVNYSFTKRTRSRPSESIGQIAAERVNLFGAKPLGIFKQKDSNIHDNETKLETWENCFNREIKLATTQPPSNVYEEMILWTEKGMLWHFPIDNEQGLEEEKKIPFYEHVHLERHLDGWCPDKGPIRHFMELVCVGLSKNPWLTVNEKLEHIWWFRNFFTEKAKLIKDIGAGEIKLTNNDEASI